MADRDELAGVTAFLQSTGATIGVGIATLALIVTAVIGAFQ